MPKLSILVPTYNRMGWLKECLESLLRVDVDCEIVVSDNASTDETESMMRSHGDRRIDYVRQAKNLGCAANYEFLLARARGQYLCLLNDDDRVLPGGVERRVNVLDTCKEIDFVHSLWQLIDQNGKVVVPLDRTPLHLGTSFIGGHPEFPKTLLTSVIQHQAAVFRRELYEKRGGFVRREVGLEVSHDWEMMIRYTRNTETAFLHEATVQVRVHPESMSFAICRKNGFARDRLALLQFYLLREPNPPVLNDAAWDLIREQLRKDVVGAMGESSPRVQDYINDLATARRAHEERLEKIVHWATRSSS